MSASCAVQVFELLPSESILRPAARYWLNLKHSESTRITADNSLALYAIAICKPSLPATPAGMDMPLPSTAKEKRKIIPASTLKDVANRYPDIAEQAHQFQEQLDKIVEHAKDFKRELVKNSIDPMMVHNYMTWEAANIVEIFRTELDKPLPDEKDESARSRN
ncbi:hypothetical protein H1R20_g6231, partial [Candolleomyces eurysporus]